jgi:hypothetical protein
MLFWSTILSTTSSLAIGTKQKMERGRKLVSGHAILLQHREQQKNTLSQRRIKKVLEETLLKQLNHEHDTNNVEGFNEFLKKFLPKDRTHCQTMENKARIMLLAVGQQSMGHRQPFWGRVFELTRIEVTNEDNMTRLFFLRSEDAEKLWSQLHQQSKNCAKTNRMRDVHEKLREGFEKLKEDNAKALLGHQFGMMGPGGQQPGGQESKKQQQRQQRQKDRSVASIASVQITHR